MLTVIEAIEKRRSIRKFKPDPVPDELINQMLEAARLAPSASNRQPWRFQIIKDPEEKEKVFRETTFGQRHIFEAPVVIVCGSELLTFVKGHKMAPPGSEYFGADSDDWDSIKEFIPDAQLNTAIAVEHMVLVSYVASRAVTGSGATNEPLLREIDRSTFSDLDGAFEDTHGREGPTARAAFLAPYGRTTVQLPPVE